ncbi:DUF6544 family protein [Roseinatronobacter sp. S2]|uniref:DUF6544 family protein n=1 Tax=Roseinatronobacter sp. S2 TaxID=3035471 RepID=UPI00240F9B04|nr:DUF6544 family protein [Roseinatronobacter sp. S2]WFE75204.1 hypothetical protein P8S53_02005 [Roseinatronobacter sp. S2]
MTLFKFILLALVALLLAAIIFGLWVHSRDRAQARTVWAALEGAREVEPPRYDPAMVADLPEIAQRYFARAIEPGTPLHRVVRLEMEGSFIMNGNPMPMIARQILAPPAQGFVWQAEIGVRLMRFAGSDGYHRAQRSEESWTKFWLRGLIPLARIGGTVDHTRAAATRVMLEAIWAPASLLPQFGAQWVQTGPDSAEVRFADTQGIAPMQITLNAEGNPVEVWALRWTDANPERVHRLQPFGGRMLEMGRYQGFLVPMQVELGNMWGTPDYAPFFLATITSVEF